MVLELKIWGICEIHNGWEMVLASQSLSITVQACEAKCSKWLLLLARQCSEVVGKQNVHLNFLPTDEAGQENDKPFLTKLHSMGIKFYQKLRLCFFDTGYRLI